MENTDQALDWIYTQRKTMISLVEKWVNINTGSDNTQGINAFRQLLQEDFAILGGDAQIIPLPPRKIVNAEGLIVETPSSPALRIMKRREAPHQIFLGGHMDTVFSQASPFQKAFYRNPTTLCGPGVSDLKGGLAIMLKGLEAFERSPFADSVGWEILFNPDEEIGSPSSDYLFVEGAKRNEIGLIFEPAYPDGAFVSARKGSANFLVTAKGRASHAGRDFHSGKSAIYAIADFIKGVESLNDNPHQTTINVGHIQGGGPVNIVPEFALCRFNIRTLTPDQYTHIKEELQKIISLCQQRDGIAMNLIEQYSCPPKPFNSKTQSLFAAYQECAVDLNIPFHCRESGGVCDGNRLSAAGLPTLDSAGAVGGNIHTEEEYLNLDSLTERARLLTLFLIKFAKGDLRTCSKLCEEKRS